MKAWTDLQSVAKPPRIAALPVDARGYPIPAFASIVEGKPDFRVVDPQAWFDCVMNRKCGICGDKLPFLFAFVGGPRSTHNGKFADAAMHPECAEYALKVCPFLAAPKFGYSELVPPVEGHDTQRPAYFGLTLTKSYQILRHGEGLILAAHRQQKIEHDRKERVTWWRGGQQLDSEPEENTMLKRTPRGDLEPS